jgi:hypothetical protein
VIEGCVAWIKSTEGSTWAAWVQALGSVAAIVYAVRIATDQKRRDEKRRADTLQDQWRAAIEVADRAAMAAKIASECCTGGMSAFLEVRHQLEVMRGMKDRLGGLTIPTAADAYLVTACVDVEIALAEVIVLVERAERQIPKMIAFTNPVELATAIDKLRAAADKLRSTFRASGAD